MEFKKEVIVALKKLGFRQHKDFHNALYVWNPDDEIIAYCEPKFFNDNTTVCFMIGFTYKKPDSFTYYTGYRASNNECGYIGCYEEYCLVHGGKVTQDTEFVNGIDITSWDMSQKEELFSYMQNEMIDFFKKNTTKTNFEKIALKKGADIAAAIYEERGEIEKTIEILSRDIGVVRAWDDVRSLRKTAYLEYLKNGTPLPDIKDPDDNTSLIQMVGNDIYIFLNKKTIKDSDMLEYFGGIENFDKPQKVSYEDMNNDEGITICKAGKWSILRIGIDMFLNYDKEKIENMLSDMSKKYNRAILFVNQDTTNTFGFEVYKKGEFLRRWMAGDGEILENICKPITGEKKRFGDTLKDEQDAQSVTDFLDSILKITYGDLEKSKTLLYEMK